jgi:flagellar hook-basal body complex protein FliE
MIDPVESIGTSEFARAMAPIGTASTGTGFADWLTQQVTALNEQINDGDLAVRRLALGETGNLHEVMMRLEQAKLSFELAVQVRNRVLEAYQDIARMQI